MNNTMNHRRAVMTPKADKITEIEELLKRCEAQINLKKAEGGPLSWYASFEESTNLFFVDSVFADEESLAFHASNIGPILKDLQPLLAGPPETTVHPVFSIAE